MMGMGDEQQDTRDEANDASITPADRRPNTHYQVTMSDTIPTADPTGNNDEPCKTRTRTT